MGSKGHNGHRVNFGSEATPLAGLFRPPFAYKDGAAVKLVSLRTLFRLGLEQLRGN